MDKSTPFICTKCKSVNFPKANTKAAITMFTMSGIFVALTALFGYANSTERNPAMGLFIVMFIAAAIVTLSLAIKRLEPVSTCPDCQSKETIPASTPEGKRLYEESKK